MHQLFEVTVPEGTGRCEIPSSQVVDPARDGTCGLVRHDGPWKWVIDSQHWRVLGAQSRLAPALSPLGRERALVRAALASPRGTGVDHPLLPPRGEGARRADEGGGAGVFAEVSQKLEQANQNRSYGIPTAASRIKSMPFQKVADSIELQVCGF